MIYLNTFRNFVLRGGAEGHEGHHSSKSDEEHSDPSSQAMHPEPGSAASKLSKVTGKYTPSAIVKSSATLDQ